MKNIDKLKQELQPFIQEVVRKELKKDPQAEQFKQRLLQLVGCDPDEAEDLTVLQAFDQAHYCAMRSETYREINNIAAPYFSDLLRKQSKPHQPL